jgi:hypothetical protein
MVPTSRRSVDRAADQDDCISARTSIEASMSAPTTHTTPDGSTFRVSNIQAVRDQSLFRGQKFTFQVESEAVDGGASFEVVVTFAPIFIAIASPEDRLRTDDYAEDLVKRTLDGGNCQDLRIHVTSDGAVMVGDKLLERLYPITKAS